MEKFWVAIWICGEIGVRWRFGGDLVAFSITQERGTEGPWGPNEEEKRKFGATPARVHIV